MTEPTPSPEPAKKAAAKKTPAKRAPAKKAPAKRVPAKSAAKKTPAKKSAETPPTTPPPVEPETTQSASARTAAELPPSEPAPSSETQLENQSSAPAADAAPEVAPVAEVGAVPSFDVTLRIRRFDPETSDGARWEEFRVTVHGTDRLLDALHKIKWEQDGSLTFRRSCAHGVCGSDAMRINGRNRLACKTLLKDLNPDKPIVVEPIKGLPVEKDLVVDMEPFFQSYREVMPFLITEGHEPTRERIQAQADRDRFDDTTKCILCAACTSSCPVFWTDGQYFGPAAIVNAHRFIFDSRDDASDLRLEILNDREGVWRCRTTFNCTEACPRGIEVTKAIQEVKRALLTRRI